MSRRLSRFQMDPDFEEREGPMFRWNEKLIRAALLVAEDDMSLRRIAEEVGIAYPTLLKKKNAPEFKQRVAEHLEELEAEMLRLPIAKRRKRIARLNDMSERVQMLIDDRATVFGEDESIVGGRTGIVVKQTKSIGFGKNAQIVIENAFDRALLMELRAIDEQAAKETGQWVDRGELTGKNGSPLILTEVVINRGGVPEGEDGSDEDPDEGDNADD